MKIKLLGTGALEGIPAFRCKCKTCSEARQKGGKFVRQNASAYIEGRDGERVLIDVPPSILLLANRAGISDEELDAIFITHADLDHIGGIFNLLCNHNQQGFESDKIIDIYMPEDVINKFEKRMDLNHFYRDSVRIEKHYSFSLKKIAAYTSVQVGHLTFQALETNHYLDRPNERRECFGYLIAEKSKSRIAYLSDVPIDMPGRTYEILESKDIDCLVMDCTFSSSTDFPVCSHLDIQQLAEVHRRLQPKKTFATHISHRNKGHNDLKNELSSYGIDVAYDGLEIDLT